MRAKAETKNVKRKICLVLSSDDETLFRAIARFQVCLEVVLVDPIRHLDDSSEGLVFLLENRRWWKKKVIVVVGCALMKPEKFSIDATHDGWTRRPSENDNAK